MKFSTPLLALLLLCFNSFSQGITVTANTTGATVPIHDFLGLNSTDVNKPGLGFDNPTIINDLGLINTSTLRFPGGTVANWWDWQTGRYIDPINPATSCYGLPLAFGSIDPQNSNTLINFKNALSKSGAQPIWVLNLLSSNLASQLSMLGEAELLGMPIENVELGNEFYLDNDCYIEKYPRGDVYGNDVSLWTQAIKDRFPNAKVSCIGSPRNNTPATTRLDVWNSELQNNLKNSSLAKPDAFTIHEYKTAGFSTTSTCTSINFSTNQSCTPTTSIPKWSYFFGKVFDHYQTIQNNVFPQINPTTAINHYKYWFTEYNLLDRSYIIHGTWAQALHTGLMTLMYLQDADKIEHVNC